MANDEELLNGGAQENAAAEYTDDNIVTLEGLEHVRLRPGMYIGKIFKSGIVFTKFSEFVFDKRLFLLLIFFLLEKSFCSEKKFAV